MIHFYRFHKKILFSKLKIYDLPEINPKQIDIKESECFYYLQEKNWKEANSIVVFIHPEQISGVEEGINVLKKPSEASINFDNLPDWLIKKFINRRVCLCNYGNPRWKDRLDWAMPEQWQVNIVGLGNVGGTLLIGLRLLGGEKIKEIGIFDTNKNVVARWEKEVNQIVNGLKYQSFPPVKEIQPDRIFQSDMVVFCISIGVPPPGKEAKDVRMMQLQANSKIINYYAQRARKIRYNGIFAVVSDPVDLLCQSAFLTSNINEEGNFDGKGLSSDQIRGFGLGVMHGRAAYYSKKDSKTSHYLKKGRVFGPHGKGLIVADDVENYNHKLSFSLTKKVLQANIELRKIGFKPYIAPALSSGALSILSFLNQQWHYSAGFLGGIFWGSRNRQTSLGLEWEQHDLQKELECHLNKSYQQLKKQAGNLEK